MTLQIEKTAEIGFCFGVNRAIGILESAARERHGVETLGAVVHNQPVLQRLARMGIRVVETLEDVRGDSVAISSHGVSPQVLAEIRSRHLDIIDTTCPFVRRAQIAARRLADSGFYTVVYGDIHHPEVKGVLGWAGNRGVAALDAGFLAQIEDLPHRWGILSQTTQIPARFTEFARKLLDSLLVKDAEVRIIDTICHDIRRRQAAALELASRVELMLIIGGRTSANTRHLVELCATETETRLVETAGEIQSSWLRGCCHIGITSGGSTDEQTISEVTAKLVSLSGGIEQ